jgi:hypothetical protein
MALTLRRLLFLAHTDKVTSQLGYSVLRVVVDFLESLVLFLRWQMMIFWSTSEAEQIFLLMFIDVSRERHVWYVSSRQLRVQVRRDDRSPSQRIFRHFARSNLKFESMVTEVECNQLNTSTKVSLLFHSFHKTVRYHTGTMYCYIRNKAATRAIVKESEI